MAIEDHTAMKVLKFGGAALENLERVADLVVENKAKCCQLVVVVSAMGDMTDHLLQLARDVHPNPPKREQDMLISVGERISMALLAMALDKRGVKALSLTGSQSGVMTCTAHGEAEIVEVRTKRVQRHLDEGYVVIVAGFQGVSLEGEITTLGRGGSDTTAVAVGAALGAEKVVFYKDVDGIYSSDPKEDVNAVCFEQLDYDDALPLCEKGGVVHPRAIRWAAKAQLPLHVSSFSKQGVGTTIASNSN
ncbi:MAG TPA: hypothetical protein PLO43_04325 [Chlamydiales bacterium]|nr:hypothetical protein [Chlamydiales bacterium]